MEKIISYIGGVITLIGGYHLYLNVAYSDSYSFEQSIKLLAESFDSNPLFTLFVSLLIITISIIAIYLLNLIGLNIKRKLHNDRTGIDKNLLRTQKIVEVRNLFYDKVFLKFTSPKDFPLNPMYRIKGDFNEVNIKDINDNKFPHSDDWCKYETFNFTEDGIELLGGDNIIGFNLLIDENDNWDVLDRFDKPKKGKYFKATNAYSIFFLHYENVLHIDWNKDPYEGNITISCEFKYKKYGKHPFKEHRYYLDSGPIGFRQLNPNKRKNFARFDFLKPFKIYASRIRNAYLRRRIRTNEFLYK